MGDPSGALFGVLGLAGTFIATLQCFEIIVAGRNLGRRYQILLTKLDVQRLCLALWGESFGLLSESGESYDKRLDNKAIEQTIRKVLSFIQTLLKDVDNLERRYGLRPCEKNERYDTLADTNVFAASFARFESQIRQTQKQASIWKATRWAIHDEAKFTAFVSDVKELVDGLLQITGTLESIERHKSNFRQEVERISDAEDLAILEEASEDDPMILDHVHNRLSCVGGDSSVGATSPKVESGPPTEASTELELDDLLAPSFTPQSVMPTQGRPLYIIYRSDLDDERSIISGFHRCNVRGDLEWVELKSRSLPKKPRSIFSFRCRITPREFGCVIERPH